MSATSVTKCALFLHLLRPLLCCYICGDDLIVVTPTKIRTVSFPSSSHLLSESRLLGQFELGRFDSVVNEEYCGALCVYDVGCKSFSYNTAVKQCQLLASDAHLKNKSSNTLGTREGIWVHRSVGPLPRGCREDSNDLGECIDFWVFSVTTREMVVEWKVPSDEPNEDPETDYLIHSQELILSNELHRGQVADFPAETVVTSGLDKELRRHVFRPLIPGMFYEATLKAFYANMSEIQFPLKVTNSLPPERPVLLEKVPSEKRVWLRWSLEGAADVFHVWNEPNDGICAQQTLAVCELDVKTTEFTVSGLTAGQDYTFYIKSISFGKESLVLQLRQPTFTDELSALSTSVHVDSPTSMTLTINTKSGTGSHHEVALSAATAVPQWKSQSFSLSQVFSFEQLTPGDYYTLKVDAISRGDAGERKTRKYTANEIAFPDRAQKDGATTCSHDSITFNFKIRGVVHSWTLQSSGGSCSSGCDLYGYERSHTLTGLSAGSYYSISLVASVSYSAGERSGNAYTTGYDTVPYSPSVSGEGSCYGVTVSITPHGEFHRYYMYRDGYYVGERSKGSGVKTVRFTGLHYGYSYSLGVAAVTHQYSLISSISWLNYRTSAPNHAQFCHSTKDGKGIITAYFEFSSGSGTCFTWTGLPNSGDRCLTLFCTGCLSPGEGSMKVQLIGAILVGWTWKFNWMTVEVGGESWSTGSGRINFSGRQSMAYNAHSDTCC